MSKVRIHLEKERIKDSIEIKDKELLHKLESVLRLKSREKLFVFDGEGKEYSYIVNEISRKKLKLSEGKLTTTSEGVKKEVVLGFPLTRENKVDLMLQKGSELGVSKFIPFVSTRALVQKVSDSKFARWQKIITEAIRQSQRLWIPKVCSPLSFKDVLSFDSCLKLYGKKGGITFNDALVNKEFKSVFIIVGPEGDFSSDEFEALNKNNFKGVNFSDNLLRVETAAICAVSILYYIINES